MKASFDNISNIENISLLDMNLTPVPLDTSN